MMGSKALWIRGAVAALAFAVPAIALAQLPNTYQTPGATLKVDAKRVCAADFEASLKPVANWQRDQALERYGERPESFKGDIDHLVPVLLGGSNDPDNLCPIHATADMTPEANPHLPHRLPH